jgi:hypothetical protein
MNASSHAGYHRLLAWTGSFVSLGVLAVCLGVCLNLADEPTPFPRADIGTLPRFPFATIPQRIEFGTVSGDSPVETSVLIRNQAALPLTLERVVTSCPCIGIGDVPVHLDPNEAKTLSVLFDPSHDPDFEGELTVRLTGYATGDCILFQIQASVDVNPGRAERRNEARVSVGCTANRTGTFSENQG